MREKNHRIIKSENKIKKNIENTEKRNWWKIVAISFGILLIISIFTNGFSGKKLEIVTIEHAAGKTINYLNQNVLNGKGTATLKSSEEIENVYRYNIDINGTNSEVYVTKDGKLFFPQGITLPLPVMQPTQRAAPSSGSCH